MRVASFSHEQLARLYRVAQAIHVTLEPAEALQRVVQESVQLVNASSGSLALVNPTTGLLEIGASEGLSAAGEALLERGERRLREWARRVAPGAGDEVDKVLEEANFTTTAKAPTPCCPCPPLQCTKHCGTNEHTQAGCQAAPKKGTGRNA